MLEKKFLVERDILLYALRYSLGRMTFAPTTVIDNILSNLNLLTDNDINIIIKEIENQSEYGMECDKVTWMNFINSLRSEIVNRKNN